LIFLKKTKKKTNPINKDTRLITIPTIPALFQPIKVGNQKLKHRIVHASMTRMRCDETATPTSLVKEYYAQRATDGGLLVMEATIISRRSGLYPYAPGTFSKEQITEWKNVTDAVHAKGGVIYCQLWHLGRVGTSGLNEG
jgi:2,4-dienoyl-CoA reductase-like NADH-dependent reductase (Old Yellow Enzyme family)